MNTFLYILLIVSFIAYTYVFIRRFIHSYFILQLERYHMMKLVDWFYKNKTNPTIWFPLVTSIISLILIILLSFPNLIYFEFVLGLFMLPFINYKQQKKTFQLTNRMKRLFLFSAIVIVIVYLLTYFIFRNNYNLVEISFISLLIINFLVYDIVLLSLVAAMPLENYIQKRFIAAAKSKIQANKDLQIVGITGSYGKTSTKFIIKEILSKKYNVCATPKSFNTPMGITISVNNYLKNIDDYFVCEMGACKVGEIKELCDIVHPKIGIITSIGPQHLETFKNIKNIIKTKYELIESLPRNGLAILNYDNYYIRNYNVKNSVKILTYGIEQKEVDYYALNIRYGSYGATFEVEFPNKERYLFKTKLLGKHNISNILAGIALADYLNIDMNQVKYAVEQVSPIQHRLELKNLPNYNVIDDSFNANIEGVHSALDILKSFDTKKIIITPGMIELGNTQYEHNYRFGEKIAQVCDFVVLVGKKQTKPIVDALEDRNYPKEQIFVTNNFKDGMNHIIHTFVKDFTVLIENDLPDNYTES